MAPNVTLRPDSVVFTFYIYILHFSHLADALIQSDLQLSAFMLTAIKYVSLLMLDFPSYLHFQLISQWQINIKSINRLDGIFGLIQPILLD